MTVSTIVQGIDIGECITMRPLYCCALTFALAVLGSAPAAASATLVQVFGTVTVDRGAGARPVRGDEVLRPGDVVTVASAGSAQIVYDNGCVVDIAPEPTAQTVVIPSALPTCGEPMLLGGLVAAGTLAAITLTEDDDAPVSP